MVIAMLLPLTSEDLHFYHLQTSQTSGAACSPHVISVSEHRACSSAAEDPSRQVQHLLDNKKVGVVQFTEINQNSGTAFWGFYLRPLPQ